MAPFFATRYHWKHPDLLKATPEGLIPTLVDQKGRSIHESLVVVEYIDQLAKQSAEKQGKMNAFKPLLPEDPMECAQSRLAADKVNRTLCSPYYTMLVRTDPVEQRAAFDKVR